VIEGVDPAPDLDVEEWRKEHEACSRSTSPAVSRSSTTSRCPTWSSSTATQLVHGLPRAAGARPPRGGRGGPRADLRPPRRRLALRAARPLLRPRRHPRRPAAAVRAARDEPRQRRARGRRVQRPPEQRARGERRAQRRAHRGRGLHRAEPARVALRRDPRRPRPRRPRRVRAPRVPRAPRRLRRPPALDGVPQPPLRGARARADRGTDAGGGAAPRRRGRPGQGRGARAAGEGGGGGGRRAARSPAARRERGPAAAISPTPSAGQRGWNAPARGRGARVRPR